MNEVVNAAGPSTERTTRSRANLALFALLVTYVLNIIDRTLIGILAPAIKADVGISDMQIGLLGGTAFALMYTTLGVPVGWLADRFNRRKIVTAALVVWSGFTALFGFGQTFLQLFILRIGVGVGEAGGVAPSMSLVSDIFPPHQRARALALLSLAIPLGSGLGVLIGGVMHAAIDWRHIFILFGVAGAVIAPWVYAVVPEPRVSAQRQSSAAQAPLSFGASLKLLLSHRAYVRLIAGAALASIPTVAIYLWLPSFFARSYGMSLTEVGVSFGIVMTVGGMVGTWSGGWLGDWLSSKTNQPAGFAYLRVAAFAWLLATPIMALGLLVQLQGVAFLLFAVPLALVTAATPPLLAGAQATVAPVVRTSAVAVYIFAGNLVGWVVGAPLLGMLSDVLAEYLASQSLKYSLLIGMCLFPIGALFLLQGARLLRRASTP